MLGGDEKGKVLDGNVEKGASTGRGGGGKRSRESEKEGV